MIFSYIFAICFYSLIDQKLITCLLDFYNVSVVFVKLLMIVFCWPKRTGWFDFCDDWLRKVPELSSFCFDCSANFCRSP